MPKGVRITRDDFYSLKTLTNANLPVAKIAKVVNLSRHTIIRIRKSTDYEAYVNLTHRPKLDKPKVTEPGHSLDDLFIVTERLESKIDRVLSGLENRTTTPPRRLFRNRK